MNMRNDWTPEAKSFEETFYTKEETIQNVRENYDLRRFHSTEGYDLEINGVTERCLVHAYDDPLKESGDRRKIFCPITADIKCGYYVTYENSTWIIDTNIVSIDGAYLLASMSRCGYRLRWQSKSGDIVERWTFVMDYSEQFSTAPPKTIVTLCESPYTLLLPIDEETRDLKRGMRFAVDFAGSGTPEIYKITKRKLKSSEGLQQISLSYDVFDREKDQRVLLDSGEAAWICNYVPTLPLKPPIPLDTSNLPKRSDSLLSPDLNEPPDSDNSMNSESFKDLENSEKLKAVISGNPALKIGYERTYTVFFFDRRGPSIQFEWNVIGDFEVKQAAEGNTIRLSVQDPGCMNRSFLLQAVAGHSVIAEKAITVVERF